MSEQAGREMDARVAEHVMKTEKYWSVLFSCSHYGNFDTLEKAEACVAKIQGEFKAYIVPYYDEPPYSSSIAAAWEVVERFRRGCNGKVAACVDVCVTDIPDPCDTYCKIYGPDTAEVIEWADTAPLAICKAALKAVGAEGEGRRGGKDNSL